MDSFEVALLITAGCLLALILTSIAEHRRLGTGSPDYPFLRVRMYAVAMPMDSIQAFYARQWAGFRFVLMETQQDGGVRMRTFAQFLQWRDGRVVPARDKGEIPDQPTTGMPVLLLEVTNPSAEARQAMRLPRGRVISSLTFLNLRSSDAH